MNILKLSPNESGGYPPIQTWGVGAPPDGYAKVDCDTDIFCLYRGFVNPIIIDGIVTGFTGNQAALDAYLAEHPDIPQPTDSEVLAALIATLAGKGIIP